MLRDFKASQWSSIPYFKNAEGLQSFTMELDTILLRILPSIIRASLPTCSLIYVEILLLLCHGAEILPWEKEWFVNVEGYKRSLSTPKMSHNNLHQFYYGMESLFNFKNHQLPEHLPEILSSLKMPFLKHDFWPTENEFQKPKTCVLLRIGSIIIPRSDFLRFITGCKIFEALWRPIWQIA